MHQGPQPSRLRSWVGSLARSLDARQVASWDAILFGEGDHRTPTESRPLPPTVEVGDELTLGSISARAEEVLGHPRMITLAPRTFARLTASAVLAGMA